MVRLLIFVLLIYLLYRVLRIALGSVLKHENKTAGGTVDEMVQDPSCQTYIPLRDAKRKVIEGQVYYFCSTECCEEFEEKIGVVHNQGSNRPCHSERSEESLKKTASPWRFFASLRMTRTKVFIKCCLNSNGE